MKKEPLFASLILSILCLTLVSCGKKEPPDRGPVIRPVKMMKVGELKTGRVRSYPGKVDAAQRVELAFQVAGPIVDLPVNEGDLVQEGQVVAQIRKEDFVTVLNNAKSRLETAQAELRAMEVGAREEDRARLEANLAAAQAKFNEAQVQFDRARELLREEVIPQSRFDTQKATYEVAQSDLQSAHQALEIGLVGAREEDIQAKQAEIKALQSTVRQAEIDLRDTTLVAPFTGRIARLYVDNYENVDDKEPILSLQDVSTVLVIVHLPETDVINAKRGSIERAYARFDGVGDREFELSIKEFSTEADEKTQTYKVTLEMPAPEDVNILPGMTAQVFIDFGTKASAGEAGYDVPLTAILNETEDNNFVWRIDPDSMKVTKVPVRLGTLSGDNVTITEGIEKGDLIAIAGVHYLREGMKVRPLVPPTEGEGSDS